ncbi:MAG: DNA translocase FtsK, partial [Bacteroidia bacterium]|nr:DNA translocase FtsK [Bacteroidia bacterium]
IGRGDLLFSNGSDLIRIQNAFIDTPEVERLVEWIANQPGYSEPYYLPDAPVDNKTSTAEEEETLSSSGNWDSMFEEAARLIVTHQQGSTSLIQRRMKLGYNRAGRIMDQLEKAGIVGGSQGSKPREVLIKTEAELEQLLLKLL